MKHDIFLLVAPIIVFMTEISYFSRLHASLFSKKYHGAVSAFTIDDEFEDDLATFDDTKGLSVKFVNEFNFDVTLNWKGDDKIVKIADIPAKTERNINTFLSHIFFATSDKSTAVNKRVGRKQLIIDRNSNRYIIGPEKNEVCRDDSQICRAANVEDDEEDDIDLIIQSKSHQDAATNSKEAKIVEEASRQGVKIAANSNVEGKAPEVSFDDCRDRQERCAGLAKSGECVRNPGWMIVNCAFSCKMCDLRDPKIRCDRKRLNISTDPIYEAGDMDAMFSNIEREYSRYNVTVLSRSPWIVTFDNFLTDEEADALISTNEGNWERSTDTGQVNAFGETGRVLSTGRTSSNAWCREPCISNPHVKRITKKIERIVRIPQKNFEAFQVLQYGLGQKYNEHHDMSPRQCLLSCGPRILTFFLYLSDVEEGGETKFPKLGYAVKPKKGKALLWPSVMNDNLEQIDPRTNHEAAAVIKGKKYAANTWIHLYDFMTSNHWGCTGTFG